MRNLLYLFLLCCTVVLMYSCEKEDDELLLQQAPETTENINVMQSDEVVTDLSIRTTTIMLTDVGWSGYTQVDDCTGKFTNEEWQLTLTSCAEVSIRVQDAFIIGDYFEVFIDGNSIGITPDPGYLGSFHSDATFTLQLDPGTYLIQVQDLFDFDAYPHMCPAGLYVYITLACCDADGDGCCDEDDAHPNSDPNPTVVIDGCDSGVPNYFDPALCGSNLGDLIMDLAADAENHGQFVSLVAHLLNYAKKAGWITGAEKGAIQACAAKSGIPYD